MEKNKLYITISDERSSGTPTKETQQGGVGASRETKKNHELSKYIGHEFYHLVKNQAVRFVNFSIGNVGNFKGDYISQRKINQVKSAVSSLVSIGVATYHGAQIGGVVGGAVGFAFGTAVMVAESVYRDIETQNEFSKTNYNIEQIRTRSGLDSLRDGSRGTEN